MMYKIERRGGGSEGIQKSFSRKLPRNPNAYMHATINMHFKSLIPITQLFLKKGKK